MNKKQSISFRCLHTALELMPMHFSFRLVLSIVMAVLPLLGMAMSRRIYNFVDESLLSQQPIAHLLFPIIVYAFYLLITKAYSIYYQRVAIQFGAILTFEKKIKMNLHRKTGEVDMRFYEDPSFYNGLWEAKVASTNIYRVAECIINFISISISIIVLSGYVATIEPTFFIFIVLTALPSLAEQVCEGTLRSKQQKKLAVVAKEERTRWGNITDISSAKERIVYGSYPFLKKKWINTIDQYRKTEFELDRKLIFFSSVFSLIKTISVAAVYILASWFYYVGNVDYAGFITTISVGLFLQAQYGELFETAGYYSEFTTLVKPYYKFMDIESSNACSNQVCEGTITLQNVSFSYPSADKNAISNINLQIHQGAKVAIVGVNGAGKSTLAKILSGLLNPTEGVIGGINQNETCVMFQDFQCYALSKDENIVLHEQDPSEPDLLRDLTKKLEIDDIPSSEVLGREFGNRDLSGGQWQKIAIARLFYHGGSILILDEPTSAIDPLYEKQLNEFIINQSSQVTTLIVISHRLSISKLLDYVYVLEDGRIIEEGTHDELLKAEDSVYNHLWEAQTSWYK